MEDNNFITKFWSNLSIKFKFLLSIYLILFIAVAIVLGTILQTINANAEKSLREYSNNEIEKVKQGLENYVNMAYEVVDRKYKEATKKENIERRYGRYLSDLIELAYSEITLYVNAAEQGKMTVEEAQAKTISFLKTVRYDDGTGYIWINDMTKPFPKMIMHPTVSSLDGKVLDASKFNCARGKNENLFKAFVEVVETHNGSGFVDYLWPKPTKDGLTKDQPKLSYVREIKQWKWIIGTGVYVDDALSDAVEDIKNTIRDIRYDNGEGYIWINDMTKPFPKMIMHPIKPSLEGKPMDDPIFNCAFGKKENVGKAFVDICEKKHEGFVDYVWPKPTKDGGLVTKEQPKLSFVKEYKPLNWIIGTGVYIDHIDEMIAQKKNELKSQTKKLLLKIGVVFLFAAVILLLFINYLSDLIIVKPLNSSNKWINKVATGDFTSKIDFKVNNDEIGKFILSLQRMIEELKAIIRNVSSASMDLKNHGMSLQGAATQLLSESQSTQMHSGAIKNNAKISSESVTSVAGAMEEMAATINEISMNTTKAKDASDNANEKAQAANQEITSLSQSANKVGDITKLIGEIASQTNLLALNATIEAARAGEMGKGFAVVANEVKELAKQTAQAVGEIENIVHEIQSRTKNTSHEVTQIVDAVSHVTDITNTIAAAIEQQSTAASEISRRIQLAGSQVLNTFNATDSIVKSSNMTIESADSIKESADELNRLSKMLLDEMKKFSL